MPPFDLTACASSDDVPTVRLPKLTQIVEPEPFLFDEPMFLPMAAACDGDRETLQPVTLRSNGA